MKKIINLALLALCSIGLTVCPSDDFAREDSDLNFAGDVLGQEDSGGLVLLDFSPIRFIAATRSNKPQVDWDVRTGEIILIESTYDELMKELQGWSQEFLSEDGIYKVFFQNSELTEESAGLLLSGLSQGPLYIVEQKKDPRLVLHVAD